MGIRFHRLRSASAAEMQSLLVREQQNKTLRFVLESSC
jgi:hypothetical protein